jgi:hypothetical protein
LRKMVSYDCCCCCCYWLGLMASHRDCDHTNKSFSTRGAGKSISIKSLAVLSLADVQMAKVKWASKQDRKPYRLVRGTMDVMATCPTEERNGRCAQSTSRPFRIR